MLRLHCADKRSAALSHSLSQPRCGVGIYIVPRHLWISYPIYVNRKAEILKILSGTQNDRGVLARMAQEYVELSIRVTTLPPGLLAPICEVDESPLLISRVTLLSEKRHSSFPQSGLLSNNGSKISASAHPDIGHRRCPTLSYSYPILGNRGGEMPKSLLYLPVKSERLRHQIMMITYKFAR